jgi:4-hydroxy-tetrahydrodipicolinate synthase
MDPRAVLPESPSVIVAMLTPFTRDGRVDASALRAHVGALVEEGVDAVMPCGTTGEGPLLDDDEVIQVVTATLEAAAGRVPVMAHAGRPATQATTRLARRAVEAGAHAVSAVVPYYYPLSQEKLIAHYRAVVKSVPDVPVFAYNIPARTVNDLEPSSLAGLARDGLAGLKDSTGAIDRHLEYLAMAQEQRQAGRELAVYAGSEGLFLDSVLHGSAGAVSALANLRPDLVVRMKWAFVEGREDDARALQEECRAVRAEMLDRGGLPTLKRAVADALRGRGIDYPPYLRGPLE